MSRDDGATATPVLVLITTNEELQSVHPALSRPGDASPRSTSSPSRPAEATKWLRRHSAAAEARGKRTLAGLYAIVHKVPVDEPRQMGF